MTTNKQLQEWLKRFPDNAEINVLTSEERSGYWESYIDVCVEDLKLPDIYLRDLTWQDDFDTVQFDIMYDYDAECNGGVKSITLGKHHND